MRRALVTWTFQEAGAFYLGDADAGNAGLSKSLREELAEHLKTRERKFGPPCATCMLPPDMLRLIQEGRQTGAHYSDLASFLKRKGFNISDYQIGQHFRRHER